MKVVDVEEHFVVSLHSALELWTVLMEKCLQKESPDSQVKLVKQLMQYTHKFCMRKTVSLSQYGSFISSRIYFHTMELDKTMEIKFSNLFLQCFQNVSIL